MAMKKFAKNTIILLAYTPIIIFYCAILYILLAVTQILPSSRLRRKVTVCLKRFSFHFLVAILSHWFPNPVYIKFNPEILKHRRTITISNHCSDYDWFFLLVLFHEMKISDTHILLKKSLGTIPFIGFILKRFGHICLNRARVHDIDIIKKAVKPLLRQSTYNIAMYPEGTYLFPEAIKSTREYAKKTKVEVDNEPFIPKLVLLPRKTGFNVIRESLGSGFDGVIDITIMMNPYVYMPSRDCPPYELFFTQNIVMNQFMIVDYIPRENIETDFLDRTFKRKEERIKAYIDYTQEPVDSEKKFIKTINKIENTLENEVLRTIQIYTPYGPAIIIVPYAFYIFIYFACLSSLQNL
ncbi:lysocardiolipin and lysophospholipid acyltransferase [Pancytospora epiphaga]|nr:lysocardiolipin and lysophospholipid acyltransferase [Pancytospora epiphaga]